MTRNLPFTEERPWGKFREFATNEPVTVKIISVNRGGTLSLQSHQHRNEFWKIIKGTPLITNGDKVFRAKEGEEFLILVGAKHRISATDDDVEFLEVSRGVFDEGDITRYEDKYGRT